MLPPGGDPRLWCSLLTEVRSRVAEALQSENLTLKKAAIIIFKQLIEARGGQLPAIDGVDWASEKAANGKSGRALNYIISQEARVDNRISTEEIANYDSDTQMLDPNSRTCPNSPASRQSSPQSTVGDISPAFWGPGPGAEYQQQQQQLASHKKRKATKYGYPSVPEVDVAAAAAAAAAAMSAPQSASPYLNPGLLSVESLAPAFATPPTPPTGLDTLDYLPREQQLQWSSQRQQQPGFYDERYLLQRYADQTHIQQQASGGAAGPGPGPACDDSMHWTTPECFQYLPDDRDYGK